MPPSEAHSRSATSPPSFWRVETASGITTQHLGCKELDGRMKPISISRARRPPPTLGTVASDASLIAEATANELSALLCENAAMQSTLTAALLRRSRAERQAEQSRRADTKLITIEEACMRASLTPRWFYRRADTPKFPWIRRLSNRVVRIDSAGLDDFMRARKRR
jgi:predicted DNA-binding transcriptional regulator AlpA